MKSVLTSRKFWAMIGGILAIVAQALQDKITWAVAVPSLTGVIAAYILGTGYQAAGEAKAQAIVDAAKKAVPILLIGLLMFGLTVPAAHCQTPALIAIPQIQSVGTTDITEAVNSTFSGTIFWDKNSYRIAPGGKDLWRTGKLHNTVFALVRPDDKVQIGVATAIGYDIDVSKPFRSLFKHDKLLVVLTPYYGLSQDITTNLEDKLITKPYPGLSVTVRW